MTKPLRDTHPARIAADPARWSAQSRQSVAFYFKREYVDEPYKCWRCGAACIFSARDQQYTYEVKKASIGQRRSFCAACWSESHRLRAALDEHDTRWRAGKSALRHDGAFLDGWLALLARWSEFAPYRQDIARIAMLRRLLGRA